MIFTKKNDNTDNIEFLTLEESSQLVDINSIPVIESDNYYFIDYDTISPIREAYDLSVEDIVSTLKYNNLIESNIIVNIEDSNLIEDKSLLEEYNNYQVYSVPSNSIESLVIDEAFDEYENTHDETILDTIVDNYEEIINEAINLRKMKGRHKETFVFSKDGNVKNTEVAKITGDGTEPYTAFKTIKFKIDKNKIPDINAVRNMYKQAASDGKINSVNKQGDNTVTTVKDGTITTNTYTPKENGKYEVKTTVKKKNPNYGKGTLNKAALGVTAGGLALGAAALNRKRISRGISKLNNKLKFYRDKRNSGPIVAKIKQMIRKLQAKLSR